MNTEVKILGKSYAVRSDESETFMMETAEFLNVRMRELMSKAGNLGTEKVAILTAMNLAGEYLSLKREDTELRKALKEKAQKVLRLIDAQL